MSAGNPCLIGGAIVIGLIYGLGSSDHRLEVSRIDFLAVFAGSFVLGAVAAFVARAFPLPFVILFRYCSYASITGGIVAVLKFCVIKGNELNFVEATIFPYMIAMALGYIIVSHADREDASV